MRIIAKVLVHDNNDRLLLLKRSKSHPDFPEHWDLPGGVVENDELAIDAVVRELQEETGIQVLPENITRVYERSRHGGVVHEIFETRFSETPTVKVSWEHESYKWLTKEEILQLAVPNKIDSYFQTVLLFLGRNA